jgi:hypothetical protein
MIKKAPEVDGITAGIYQRTFTIFPTLVTSIYNQCLLRGMFPTTWKIAKIIPIIKPGKKNSTDPSKYRPMRLINIAGKVIEKTLVNRINYYLYKNKLMTNKQFGLMPQKNTTDAMMEAKRFIDPVLENREVAIMTSLDVKGAFDSAPWTGILHCLKELNCSRNVFNLRDTSATE